VVNVVRHHIRVEEVDAVMDMAEDVEEEDLVEGVVEVRYILCFDIIIERENVHMMCVHTKSHSSILDVSYPTFYLFM